MRKLFLALAGANLIFFAVWRGYLGPVLSDPREPGRVGTQVQPERMVVRAVGAEADAVLGDSANLRAANSQASAAGGPAPAACVEFGSFGPDEGRSIGADLGARFPAAKIVERSTVEPT